MSLQEYLREKVQIVYVMVLAFWHDNKGTIKSVFQDYIGLVIILIFGLGMLPTVVNVVVQLNTTNFTFTGAEGAITLIDLIPLVYIAGLVLLVVGMALYIRGGD